MSPERPSYWRSLDELAETAEFRKFVENEFPSRLDALVDPVSRRRFLQVMGASMALAGLPGCDYVRLRWPKENILPFEKRFEGRTPGEPSYFATGMELDGVAEGLVVKSFDGRPIKVEGNPEHPGSLGATSTWSQASVLDLYDPDRSQDVYHAADEGQEVSSWARFLSDALPRFEQLKEQKGKGLFVLGEPSSSATLAGVKKQLLETYPEMTWLDYSAVTRENELEGARLAFGRTARTQLALDRAKVLACFDADLFCLHPNATRFSHDFMTQRRAPGGEPLERMNRLYVVEGGFSLTGSNADHRLPIASSYVGQALVKLASLVAADDGVTLPAELKTKLGEAGIRAGKALAQYADYRASGGDDILAALARDLLAHRGEAVVAVGRAQPPAVHALAHALNHWLGNSGRGGPIAYTDEPLAGDGPSYLSALKQLVTAAAAGQVGALVIFGGNPVYDAPADLDLAAALGKVEWSAHLGLHRDETGQACTWHLPRAHYLESWSDARAWNGLRTVVQPLIQPIYDGRTPAELFALLLDRSTTGYDLLRGALRAESGKGRAEFEPFWREVLHAGLVPGTELARRSLTPRLEADVLAQAAAAPPELGPGALEVVLTPDAKVWDGSLANNGWLQELPDPLTKLTWDNALLVNPATARALGLLDESQKVATIKENLVSLTVGERQLDRVAVHILPGVPTFTAQLSLGYGRGPAAGAVADGAGFNAYPLRTTTEPWVLTGAKVSKGKGDYRLATTQDHHAITTTIGVAETERRVGELVREASFVEYQETPNFAQHAGGGAEPPQLWPSPIDYEKQTYRWGMAIDLSTCTGCSACVVACQSENNIPVVGKQEVARGREMHWLRIDRYFTGDPEADPQKPLIADEEGEGHPTEDTREETGGHGAEPPLPRPLQVAYQPMLCQQCENAPCESVCPVAATVHSEEGLNDMVYNRCIGTRYCSNNCPYKVRRFNYFWNHYGPFHPRSNPGPDELPKPPEMTPQYGSLEKMAMNPEVTVRSRGVMEKCTYCVQRIKQHTIPARNMGVKVPDGEIQTACQQACPTNAIVFGDLNDPDAAVSKLLSGKRNYPILAELNTRPRTQYLAKLRNPAVEQSAG